MDSTQKIVRAIRDLVVPETVGALHRFLGMTIYIGKFLPNLITIIKLLRDLTKKDFPGIRLESQQAVFDTVKKNDYKLACSCLL